MIKTDKFINCQTLKDEILMVRHSLNSVIASNGSVNSKEVFVLSQKLNQLVNLWHKAKSQHI